MVESLLTLKICFEIVARAIVEKDLFTSWDVENCVHRESS